MLLKMKKFVCFLFSVLFGGIYGHVLAQGSTGFIDVPSGHENIQAIGFMRVTGVMNGYEGGEFRPYSPLNRAEMMKVMVTLLYTPSDVQNCPVSDLPFSDTDKSAWYAPYICVGLQNNLLSGFPDNTFRPADNVNVAQAIKFAALTGGAPLADGNPWFAPYAQNLSDKWAMPLSLEPISANVSRRNVAEMLYRVHLWDSGLGKVNNNQEEDQFWKKEALTLQDILNGNRPKPFVAAPEPVLHMDMADPYFAERMGQDHVSALLEVVNAERKTVNNAQPVALNRQLSWAAQVHADRLVEYDFLAHVTPAGSTVRDRVTESGFAAVYFGENILRGATSPADALEIWKTSPKHYQNLLDGVYTHAGIGWAIDEEKGGRYYVMIFGQIVPDAPESPRRPNNIAGPAEGADETIYQEYDPTEVEIKPLSIKEALDYAQDL